MQLKLEPNWFYPVTLGSGPSKIITAL